MPWFRLERGGGANRETYELQLDGTELRSTWGIVGGKQRQSSRVFRTAGEAGRTMMKRLRELNAKGFSTVSRG